LQNKRERGAIQRAPLFAGLCVLGAGTIAGYVYYVKGRSAAPLPAPAPESESTSVTVPAPAEPEAKSITPAPASQPAVAGRETTSPPASSSVPAPPANPPPVQAVPAFTPTRVYFRYNGVDGHYGKLAYVSPEKPDAPTFVDALSCEVVYVAGGQGICLSAKRGVITTYSARLFDASTFTPHAQFGLNGVPSRSRVSIDGKLAAFTVFVTGHGYTALDFSTQTSILNTANGEPIADLETFTVLRDGKAFKEADFNFWGVTFTRDARDFYATLSTGGKHFLIRGNLADRTATLLHENVECPSLSPDGSRVAYKKRSLVDNRIVWQLHVLDLATGKETALAEKRSIDDQLEWLDEHTVLYSVPENADNTSPSTDVWRAASDGTSKPRLYLHKAYSPAAVR
jgi:hypothetical protein